MNSKRDRLLGIGAAVVVMILAVSVATTVLSAERNGRRALESLQLAQLDQLARLLDSAVGPALESPAGLTNPTTRQPWTLAPNDPTDRAGLEVLQRGNPSARTGYVLVDGQGVVVNGTLLTDASVVGRTWTRLGLDSVLAGTPSLLPAAPGSLTTPLQTIAIARPIKDGPAGTTGAVRGAIVNESDVAPDSAFTRLMASFRRAKTDTYSFLDSNNVVIGSTDGSLVGKPVDPVLVADPNEGFHRHGSMVSAVSLIPSAGWRTVYSQTRKEFEGSITGPLRSALMLLVVVAIVGAGLTFFALVARLRAARLEQQRLARINEAREEFISIVSHELRTPATGQLGFLQTLLDHWDTLDDAGQRQAVRQAFANARRLHALTRDVLDTASIEAGELPYVFEVIDLRDAVEEAVSAVPTSGHTIVTNATQDPVPVRADPERVQQVLANLLDNAIKHSPAGTNIDLQLSSAPDGTAVVEVSDHGAGITDDELERAFEKFSRGRHGTVKGTGLGLYICRKIIDAHGGRIWASQRPGGGAMITFTLPLASEPGSAASADADTPATAGAS